MTPPTLLNPLFADEPAPAPARTPVPGAYLSLRIVSPKLVPEALHLNRLLEKVQRLTGRLADIQALADAFRPGYHRALQPRVDQRTAVVRQTVLWLHARVQQAVLSPTLLRDAVAILCALSEGLGLAGDEVMRAVHDRHSPQTLADKEKTAAFTFVAATAATERTAQRVQHTCKPRSAAQIKVHRQQQTMQDVEDALGTQGALRAIYRQLASALHPDRERDAGERVRKTVLMGQANDAYAQRDLMALLTLQQRCAPADAAGTSRWPAAKVTALMPLLQHQVIAAEQALLAATERVRQEFALAPRAAVTGAALTQALGEQALDLAEALAVAQQDLAALQTDSGLKRWIKVQKKTAVPR